jgi:catechol 2,3-dioxygenase-like lactoylglutathione lyase family enzyme
MKVNKLDHISIAVSDLEAARRPWDTIQQVRKYPTILTDTSATTL